MPGNNLTSLQIGCKIRGHREVQPHLECAPTLSETLWPPVATPA
jgi:hypothetical protein